MQTLRHRYGETGRRVTREQQTTEQQGATTIFFVFRGFPSPFPTERLYTSIEPRV